MLLTSSHTEYGALSNSFRAFHATAESRGNITVFDSGGHYEATDEHGSLKTQYSSAGFVGYQTSDIPELAASKSPESALFGKLQNIPTDSIGDAVTVHVYGTHEVPDTDLTTASGGDFALMEEVRYQNPSDNPVPAVNVLTIDVPKQILVDIDMVYYPPSPQIIREWGLEIRSGLRSLIDEGSYDVDSGMRTNIQQSY